MSVNGVISFGCYSLHPPKRLLAKDGVALLVGSRALGILIVLTERAGEIVNKKDLIAQVWPDVAVGEGCLRFHITGLRMALGDGKAGARFVTSVPGQGYCFVAPVSRSDEPRLPAPSFEVVSRSSRLPAHPLRMVGRDEVVRATMPLLLDRRFVTIVGVRRDR